MDIKYQALVSLLGKKSIEAIFGSVLVNPYWTRKPCAVCQALFKYNRKNFMFDKHLKQVADDSFRALWSANPPQEREFQEQDMRVVQFGLYREADSAWKCQKKYKWEPRLGKEDWVSSRWVDEMILHPKTQIINCYPFAAGNVTNLLGPWSFLSVTLAPQIVSNILAAAVFRKTVSICDPCHVLHPCLLTFDDQTWISKIMHLWIPGVMFHIFVGMKNVRKILTRDVDP